MKGAAPRSSTSYPLALGVSVVTVAFTRLTWPLFASTPFAPIFGGIAIVSHWGTAGASLLAIALSALGATLVFPRSGPAPWNPWTTPVYVLVALIGSRLIIGRNRAVRALHEREAELRATLADLHESEEAVRKAQKMEAVGQLSAGVAHNFNNLLTITMGYTDVLMDADCDEEMRRVAANEIRKATERGATLARQMLTFGRRHDPRIARVALDGTVAALRDMLTRVIREDIRLHIDVGRAPTDVMIDPHDLEQVVVNLVINARDALPDGGDISLTLARETVGPGDQRLEAAAVPGEYVRLCVRDNGVGMPRDVQARLFEPFFTTKEVGEGTGLGLAFVHGVALHAGGFVSVTSAPGQGTSICVFLPPAAPAIVTSEAPPPASPPRERGTGTLLLVEDEDAVRDMTVRALQRAGYQVLAAATPSEARAIFERQGGDIPLLVTDVVMPEMRGPELAEQLLVVRPDLRVLFVSGYTDALPAAPADGGRVAFLAKPFSMRQLTDAIAALMAPAP